MGAGGICHDCKRSSCICYCSTNKPAIKVERVFRQWGFYIDKFRGPNCVFKKLVIYGGAATSFQKHEHRSEFWYVQRGEGKLRFQLEGEAEASEPITQGCIVDIPQGTWHQIINTGERDLVIYEMQAGDLCSEEDIVRK